MLGNCSSLPGPGLSRLCRGCGLVGVLPPPSAPSVYVDAVGQGGGTTQLVGSVCEAGLCLGDGGLVAVFVLLLAGRAVLPLVVHAQRAAQESGAGEIVHGQHATTPVLVLDEGEALAHTGGVVPHQVDVFYLPPLRHDC